MKQKKKNPKRKVCEKRKKRLANKLVEDLKQESRDLMKLGEVAKATKIFNKAWKIENAYFL